MTSNQIKSEIGLIPKDAFVEELGNCIELIIDHRGKTPAKLGANWSTHGIKVISAKNVNGGKLTKESDIRFVTFDIYKKWMKEDVVKGDCFLVSEGATLGECMYWDYEYPIVLGQRIFCIRTNPKKVYSKYFYSYMSSNRFQAEILGRATGTSVLGLRQTEVKKLRIPIVPLNKQKIIGNLQYSIDKKIELNRKMNQTLEAMAQTLFKSWFVNFDPVHAKADVKSDEALEGAAAELGIPKEVLELFPSELEESEMGMIPKGWVVKELKEIGTIITGKTPPTKKAENYGEKYPFITIPDMHGQTYIVKTVRYLSEIGHLVQANKLIPKDSLIISCIATVGLVSISTEDSHTNQQINNIVCDKKYLYYLYCLLHGMTNKLQMYGSAGTTTLNINKSTFESIEIILPSNNELDIFLNSVQPIFEKILANTRQIQTLHQTRDTLLPKLLSGELDVSSMEVK